MKNFKGNKPQNKSRPGGKAFGKGGGKPQGKKPYGEKARGEKTRSEKPQGEKKHGKPFGKPKPQGRGLAQGDAPRKPFTPRPAERAPREAQPRPVREREAHARPVREREAHARLDGPLLWGFHAVRAAWLNGDRRIKRLLVTDAGLAGFQDTLAEAQGAERPNPEIIDKGAFERMMPPGAVHQGVAALVDNLPERDAHDLVAALAPGEKAVILILDQVTDPHNVGAILRSAAAFGARGVIMQDRHAPELSGVLAKTASGAADVLPVAVETNLSRAIELLQEHEFYVAGLDERGDAIASLPAHDRVALVLGAEGSGLRPNVANHCDTLVSLPTQGAIKSLNVSNAAAVALYAVKANACA